LYATRALVDEVGYERLTIGGIAARAGVGKDTIYRWWPSKGLIVADAILDLEPANDDPDAPAAAFFTEPPLNTGNLTADMQEWVRQLARDYVEGPGAARVRAVTAAATEDPVTAARLVERFTQPKQAAVVARLEAAAHLGEVRLDADLAAVADSIMATLFYWAISRREDFHLDTASGLVDVLLAGLRPPR
jgi:AcrR family transcriptional regulator